MSLWDKWEREKLEKQGLHYNSPEDVEIHPTHTKPNIRKQLWIVLGALVACVAVVFAALALESLFTGRRWADTYIVRLFVERQQQRENLQ